MENKQQIDSTEEIAFARELLINLWQFRAITSSENGKAKLIPIIADFNFRNEKDLKEPIEFLVNELQKALEQINQLNK